MSLKDALSKAGFKTSNTENERKYKPKKDKKKSEVHQEHRNYCEVCNSVQPDVEKFHHRKAHISAKWICIACADKQEILDECRVTNQSDTARKKAYRRFYGPTKFFPKYGEAAPPKAHSNKSGNVRSKKPIQRPNKDGNRK